ncbi:MAG: hypothetical protein AABZ67_00405 [Pseudomonadota bacterium]
MFSDISFADLPGPFPAGLDFPAYRRIVHTASPMRDEARPRAFLASLALRPSSMLLWHAELSAIVLPFTCDDGTGLFGCRRYVIAPDGALVDIVDSGSSEGAAVLFGKPVDAAVLAIEPLVALKTSQAMGLPALACMDYRRFAYVEWPETMRDVFVSRSMHHTPERLALLAIESRKRGIAVHTMED